MKWWSARTGGLMVAVAGGVTLVFEQILLVHTFGSEFWRHFFERAGHGWWWQYLGFPALLGLGLLLSGLWIARRAPASSRTAALYFLACAGLSAAVYACGVEYALFALLISTWALALHVAASARSWFRPAA